jgi:repressor LexA
MRAQWTENRKKVASYLKDYIQRFGRAPSLDEIAQGTGLWKHSVEIVLKGLEKIGFIELTPGISRGIRLIEDMFARVPLLGEVQAGSPMDAQPPATEYLRVDPALLRFENPIALRVEGFSMRDAGILPGDIVLLRPQQEARNGDTVVASLNGGVTIKVFHSVKKSIQLRPCNPAFKTLEVTKDDEFFIVGKVMVVLRDLGGCFDFQVDQA